MKKNDGTERFAVAVGELYARGWVSAPDPCAAGVWKASHTGHGWANAAYHLAAMHPGTVWPGKRGLSVVVGNQTYRIMEHKAVRELYEARAAAAVLGLDCSEEWTTGAISRALLNYVADHRSCPTSSDGLVRGIEGGYHDCTPGEYPGTYRQFDCSGYYFQLLRRLPSLRVKPTSGGLIWLPMSPNERAKWSDVIAAIGECKPLRNSVVGSAMGSAEERPYYVKDSQIPGRAVKHFKRLPPGPFRGAGQLIVRSGYELCLLAANECHSVYSALDSVITAEENPPKVWERYGIFAKLEATGNNATDICRRACYRVGEKATLQYKADIRVREAEPPPPPPPMLYHKLWLS